MAFLSKYRNLRGENTQGMYEVEYNFGRMFHQLGRVLNLYILTTFLIKDCSLGLYSHAVKHYESVLKLAEENGVSLIPHFCFCFFVLFYN